MSRRMAPARRPLNDGYRMPRFDQDVSGVQRAASAFWKSPIHGVTNVLSQYNQVPGLTRGVEDYVDEGGALVEKPKGPAGECELSPERGHVELLGVAPRD